jgi:hypothetical protein
MTANTSAKGTKTAISLGPCNQLEVLLGRLCGIRERVRVDLLRLLDPGLARNTELPAQRRHRPAVLKSDPKPHSLVHHRTLLPWHPISAPFGPESVTHVCGTFCYLCLGTESQYLHTMRPMALHTTVSGRLPCWFAPHEFRALLRRFFHEKTRMTRFQIRNNALVLQLGGRNGADRPDDRARQSANQIRSQAHLFSHLKQASYLYRGRDQQNVNLVIGNRMDGLPRWSGIFWQVPFVDANRENLSATLGQSRRQLGTGNSILLNRNRTSPERE